MNQDIAVLFESTWTNLVAMFEDILPRLISLVVMTVVGWGVAYSFKRLALVIMRLTQFENLLDRVGIGALFARTGHIKANVLVGKIIFWAIFLTFFLKGLEIIGFDAARTLVEDLLRFIPNLLLAITILIIGFGLANFMWRAVLLWAANAHIQHAQVLGGMVRSMMLIATFAMALEQLKIGQQILQTAFAILFGGLVLAIAIAFGFGGRHLARRYLNQLLVENKEKKESEPLSTSHL